MRVETRPINQDGFEPFELVIRIDKQQTAYDLYNILNHSAIVDNVETPINVIRNAISEQMDSDGLYSKSGFYDFANKVEKWFK